MKQVQVRKQREWFAKLRNDPPVDIDSVQAVHEARAEREAELDVVFLYGDSSRAARTEHEPKGRT